MVRFIACLVFVAAPGLADAETLEASLFSLDLPSGWEIEKGSAYPPLPEDPYTLVFEGGQAGATISVYAHSREDTQDLAYFFLDARLTAEREHAAEGGLEVSYEHTMTQHLIGYQFEYVGSDSGGRLFRSWGMVREAKLINVYVESRELSEESLEELARRLIAGLRF